MRVFVVCAGTGYLVDVQHPERHEIVSCYPICSVRGIREPGLVLFGNFTQLVAYGSDGLLWKSAHLVSDDLQIKDVHDRFLSIEGLDAAAGRTVQVEVDLGTGKVGQRNG
jgi:hypothetical protein